MPPCTEIKNDLNDLKTALTSPSTSSQAKAQAAKDAATQFAADAKTAGTALKDQLSGLASDLGSFGSVLSATPSVAELQTWVGKVTGDLSATAAACTGS
ncbi:MAG TPA: hypothetical protein VK816_07075 [Jatrophihabitantaceae bacterium]|nr:hypothetical protein [Jatrophihabitantaceae bacterium]